MRYLSNTSSDFDITPILNAFFIVSTVIGAMVAIVWLVCVLYNRSVDKKVLTSSKRIEDLLQLNKEIGFIKIPDKFAIHKHYDNKSHYYKVEPSAIMAHRMRDNIDYYSDYISKVEDNRVINVEYQSKIKELSKREYIVNYDEIKLPEDIYIRHEKKLFDKNTLKPVVDCIFKIVVSYSSPKGRVNCHKSAEFNLRDMKICIDSVSRERLDKRTYLKLATVERGEVSDSLRYDILSRDNFQCVICGASSRQGVHLHVDHIVPISKGGKSIPSNLRTLCERCNIGKSNKIEVNTKQELELNIDTELKPGIQLDNSNKTTNSDNTYVTRTTKQDPICAYCGAKLVVRKGDYGEFYGCSNYPNCRYTKKIYR